MFVSVHYKLKIYFQYVTITDAIFYLPKVRNNFKFPQKGDVLSIVLLVTSAEFRKSAT